MSMRETGSKMPEPNRSFGNRAGNAGLASVATALESQREEIDKLQTVAQTGPSPMRLMVAAHYTMEEIIRQRKQVDLLFEAMARETSDYMSRVAQFYRAVHDTMHTEKGNG